MIRVLPAVTVHRSLSGNDLNPQFGQNIIYAQEKMPDFTKSRSVSFLQNGKRKGEMRAGVAVLESYFRRVFLPSRTSGVVSCS